MFQLAELLQGFCSVLGNFKSCTVMSLATVVIATHPKAAPTARLPHEFKQIQTALQPYEDRCLLAIDMLHGLSTERLSSYLSSISRRKDLWIYHQLDTVSADTIQHIHRFFPELKLLYVSHPMHPAEIAKCFEQGIQAMLITDKSDPQAYLQFANKFYQNLAAGARLEEAYEQARIFVEMEKGKTIGKPMAFSDWQQFATQESISWGLIFRQAQASNLASFLPQRNRAKLASKQEQKNWRRIQQYKHLFLANWGQDKIFRHLMIVREGPIGVHLLSRMIGEEIGLLYQEVSIKRFKLDFHPSLVTAKLGLSEQLTGMLDRHPFFIEAAPQGSKGLVLMLKIYQSQWRPYSPKVLWYLVSECLPEIIRSAPSIDIICMLVLVQDVVSEERARKKGIQIRKIMEACKVFAADFMMDIRA